ncbi:MAG: pyridoxal phosphate-dependent aminotransferase, partial [Planctomycetota bacterium]
SIQASGIRKIFELVASMPDPINLSIGQADFDVPQPVKEAAIKAIEEGFNRYTVTQGIPELNERIKAFLKDRYAYTPDESLVTCGVSGGLVLALLSLVNPGDEVLLPDPYFVMYKVLVDLCQGVPKYYSLYPDFRLRKEELEQQVTTKTKLILLNSPSNPTGSVLSPAELNCVAEVAKKHDLFVICDEIYDQFVYLDRFHSLAEYYQDKLILLGGFSKTYGMPGWRMGYATGPREVLDKMMVLQQFTFVCAPSFAQKAVLHALDLDMSEYIEKYRNKRDLVYNGLKDYFDVTRPDGSFYIFPKLPAGYNGQDFVKKAVAHNVLVVPGSAFSRQDTHFRISFAAPDDQLKKGMEILAGFAGKSGGCSCSCACQS